jgi:hypothetical protein
MMRRGAVLDRRYDFYVLRLPFFILVLGVSSFQCYERPVL